MQTLRIEAGGWAFDGRAEGPPDGPLVLLLHGFPQTSYSWRSQLAALGEAGYRAVAFDQRGYSPGARPPTVTGYAMPRLVGDVMAVADALGRATFDLVGHDWGGAVAWQVAGRHADRLRRLAVVSTPHPAAFTAAVRSGSGEQAQRSGYIDFFRQEGVAEDALLANDAAGLRGVFLGSGFAEAEAEVYLAALTSPGALTAALNWYRAASLGDIGGMGPVTTPTLYVWGTEDIALGREAAEATAGCVAGRYRFEVLVGVSHWVPEQAADALTGLLLEHLAF